MPGLLKTGPSKERPASPELHHQINNSNGDNDGNQPVHGGVNNNNSNNNHISLNNDVEGPILPSTVPYFHGRLLRKEAEGILRGRGCADGLFMLRESTTQCSPKSPHGKYAISVCGRNRIANFLIEEGQEGSFYIYSQRFKGPVEIVSSCMQSGKRLGIYSLTTPCNRAEGEEPRSFRGITHSQLERMMEREARILGVQLDTTLTSLRTAVLKQVLNDLHLQMPWFHGNIPRRVARYRLEQDGHEDGKFLVRSRNESNSYALTLSQRGGCRHYLIQQVRDSLHVIDDDPRFSCLVMLVDYYHSAGGLSCDLTKPCSKPLDVEPMDDNGAQDAPPNQDLPTCQDNPPSYSDVVQDTSGNPGPVTAMPLPSQDPYPADYEGVKIGMPPDDMEQVSKKSLFRDDSGSDTSFLLTINEGEAEWVTGCLGTTRLLLPEN